MFIFAKLHKDQNTKNTCISVSAVTPKPLIMMEGKNEYKIEYTSSAKAIKSMPKCKGRSSKSSGRMRRRTAKKQ